MQSVRHWTPRYLRDRAELKLYEWQHPRAPWLTQRAVWLLDRLLKPSDVGLEWGSGRSTLWFARRSSHLVSVEHNEDWYRQVEQQLARARVETVDYRLAHPPAEVIEEWSNGHANGHGLSNGKPDQSNAYVDVIDEFEPNSLGFALVDGLYRGECALRATEKLKPGGVLIVDNVNWFIPSRSVAPGSRPIGAPPASEAWAELIGILREWRTIWTSNGVTDTAVWLKP